MSFATVTSYVSKIAREPSTYAGGGVIALALHAVFPGALGDSLIVLAGAIGGVISVLAPEKSA